MVATAGCDWPTLPGASSPEAEAAPWPALWTDAALGIGRAAPEPAATPDLDARAAALRARADTITGPVIDAATAQRLASATD